MAAATEIPSSADAAAAATGSKLDSKPNLDSEFNMQKLVDIFTKLNPLAEEFIPSSYAAAAHRDHLHQGFNQWSPNPFLVNNNNNKPLADDQYPNANNRRVWFVCLSFDRIVNSHCLILLVSVQLENRVFVIVLSMHDS